MINNGYPSMHR